MTDSPESTDDHTLDLIRAERIMRDECPGCGVTLNNWNPGCRECEQRLAEHLVKEMKDLSLEAQDKWIFPTNPPDGSQNKC